ncbi:transmembrane protein, putative (macronuclear) [Tetrahymena thermophila SB210]|uniref:Transmembrane protein, putative n=1 Tax=Tetrahymena thermophila (strain SB210) TaxID=312017 RepID=I7LW37_TETTS|nr:transmembrane protein, putative [Tetrahymena thermophila SB210]EAS00772.1 transmembrane protein, putative [Tetrahymena thermophila SB210]|eukprot:XP_001021017.1 transmembrane protein, putative [Tetrahymena thermophila SB210]
MIFLKFIIRLILAIQYIRLVTSYCTQDKQFVQRSDTFVQLVFKYNQFLNVLVAQSDNSQQLTATSSLFQGLVINDCRVIQNGCSIQEQPSCPNDIFNTFPCSISGSTITLQPWQISSLKTYTFMTLYIQVDFKSSLSIKPPQQYDIQYNYSFTSSSQNTCTTSYIISPSRPASLSMSFQTPTTQQVVSSSAPIQISYTPQFDTSSDSLQIMINQQQFNLDFSSTFTSQQIWAYTRAVFNPTGPTVMSTQNCILDQLSQNRYYCLQFNLNSQFVFKQNQAYTILFYNLNYPFHPLGFADVQFKVMQSQNACEQGTVIASSAFMPTNFKPQTGLLTLKSIQFCIDVNNCQATGQVLANYKTVSITIQNPTLLATGTRLDLIFNMDFILFASSDNNRAVQISFASSGPSLTGSFSLNQPASNQMLASFTLARSYIPANDITITISNAFMGFDTKNTYAFYLNAICSSSLSSNPSTPTPQYQMNYSSLSLNNNVFKTLSIDGSIPFQIGQSSNYNFNIIPSNSFTSSQMQITITFPSNTYKFLTATNPCYAVTLNGSIQIDQSKITETKRDSTSGTVILQIAFPTPQTITSYSVSICSVQNPMVTGSSGNIQVAANYGSNNFLTENGSVSTTISPAPFATGTSVAPKDNKIMQTMASNGYTFTLNLPVQQKAQNTLKIVFPNYLANSITFSSSSVTFNNQQTNQQPNIYWQGQLASDVTTAITITFTGYNPPLTQTNYVFKATMYDSNGNPQLSSDITLSTAAYTPATCGQILNNRSSKQNGDSTDYTFTINTNYFMDPSLNFFMRIQLDPTQAVTNLNVQEISKNLKGLTSTQTNDGAANNYIDITASQGNSFQYISGYNAQFIFKIQTITNYRSTKPITGLQIISGISAKSLGCTQTYSWNDNIVKPLSQNSVSITNIDKQYFEQQATYSFKIQLDIAIPQNGYFDIVGSQNFPTTVQINSNPASMFTFTPLTNPSSKIRITCIQQSCTTFTLIINPISNPNYASFLNGNTPILTSISTYDQAASDYLIQSVQFSLNSLNYFNQCYTSQPYKSFCKDCQNSNQNYCTSCYSGSIFNGQTYNLLDTINNVCVSTCPTISYNNGASQCVKCINNCATCTSATTCQSCVSPYQLQDTTCQQNCNPTYYSDSNRVCQKCDQTKCLNCQGSSTNCLSCQPGFGLITVSGQSSCVNCSQTPGYYDKKDNSGTCGICNPLCTQCSGNANNCSACVQISNGQAVYFNPIANTCTTSCERDGYNLLKQGNTYVCGVCTNSCNTCKNQSSYCTSCSSPLYLLQNKCITKSEITDGFYPNDAQHTADSCSSVCTKCVSSQICTSCIPNFFMVAGQCLSQCPNNLPVPDGSGGCKEDTSSKVSNIQDDNKVVPFPMLLASIAFCISIYFSKYEYHATFVPGCVVGFCSLFEWISWIALIATASDYSGMQSAAAVLALLGFLFLYIINIIQFIMMKKYIETDTVFMEWVLNNHKNKVCFTIIKYASLIISFKATRIIFSKYFNQGFFKAKLNSIDLFSPFNKLAIVSVLMNSSLIIISSAIATYTYAKQTQGFFLGLDSLIVTIMMIIFMIWDSLKKKDFFEEPVDLNQTFSQRFLPFDQSYMDRLHSKVLENSARMNRGESNSSLVDFKENKKVTVHEGLQKPLQQVLDPSEMSANASIDKNVLKNSENGAFYLIQDHLYESYKPGPNGGKRHFEKKHIAPQFDYSKYNPIQEHSNEDELDDDDERMDLKNRQGQMMFDQSGLVKESNMENQRASKGKRNSPGGGQYGNQYQDEEEPVPQKPNTRHTVYYNENVQGMLNSVSTKGANNSQLQNQEGVSIGVNMNQEEDEENRELRQRLYSKPSDIMNGDQSNPSAVAAAMMMRQSYSPKQSNLYENQKTSKTEGNRQSIKNNSTLNNSPSSKSKKKTSPSRSRSISPSLAKIEDKKMKKSTSPKKQKSQNSDEENNMRNSQTSNKSAKSNKSKKSQKKGKGNDDDNMLFYFAHPVDGDQALPPNQANKNSQKKKENNNQNKNNGGSKGNQNEQSDDNKVERIMPIEENLDEPLAEQKQVQPKYDLANQMKMKGPYNNDRIKSNKGGLMGVENEDDPEDLQNRSKGLNYQGSQDIDRNIYDSSESVRTAEEADMNYNEVSPSDFNVLNQRYEEDFFAIQLQQQIQRQQQLSGNNLMINPDIQSIQMGSVIQSPNNQLLSSQQAQLMGGSVQQRPPLILANSNSNISIANPKTTKSAGGGKKKSKSKTRSSSKNHPNLSSQNNPFNHAVIHQGLMTPSSGSVQGMRSGQGFMQQDIDPMTQKDSPVGSHRTGRGADVYHSSHSRNIRPNSQDQSDGFMRSNTQNMYHTSNSKTGNPMASKVSGGGSRMGNISPSNSNQVITYKVPQTDINKLKSLEKIYLQRLEIQGNNNAQSSNKKPKKNKQQHSGNVADFNNDFDQNSVHSSQMHNMNGFFKPDSRQARDTSDIHAPSAILMEDPNSMVIADFGDDIYKD